MNIRLTLWLLLLCGMTALLGCAHYAAQPLAPEKTAARLEARRLDAIGLQQFIARQTNQPLNTWPPAEWDLNSLTLAAFYFHPDLAVARAEWQLAEAGVQTAAGRPNPTLTITPEYNASTLTPTPWAPAINFDLPLETMGKRGHRRAAAESAASAAQLRFLTAAWQLRSNVRQAWLDWVGAQKRSGVWEEQCALHAEIVQRGQQRLSAGTLTQAELGALRLAQQRAQLEFAAAQTKLGEARSRLAEALGLPMTALAGIALAAEFPQPVPTEWTTDQARRAALVGRPDIRAALADYAATEARLRLEIAKQFPDVHLNPGYQFDQGDNKWSLGLTVELPLLNQNQGPIAEARAQRELAAAKFLQLQAQIIAALERALTGLTAAQAQLKTSRTLGELAQQQETSVAAQLRAGAAEPLDLANAKLDTLAARLTQLDSEAQWQYAIGALEDALQRPIDPIATVIEKIHNERKSNEK